MNAIREYHKEDRLFFLFSDPYYADAWWAKLGYTSGRVKTTLGIYHSRYHDGYSACSGDDFQDCSGVLLGSYSMVGYALISKRACRHKLVTQIGRRGTHWLGR